MSSVSERLYNYFNSINTYISNKYSKLSPEKRITSVALAIFCLLLGGSLFFSLHRFYQSKKLKPIDGKAAGVAEKIIKKDADNKPITDNKLKNAADSYSKEINDLVNYTKQYGKEFIDPSGAKWFGQFTIQDGLPTGIGTVTYFIEDGREQKQIRETRAGEFRKGQLSGLGRVHNNFKFDFWIHEGLFKDGIHVEGIRKKFDSWEEGNFGTPVKSDVIYLYNGLGKKFHDGILYEGKFKDSELIKGKKILKNGEIIIVDKEIK